MNTARRYVVTDLGREFEPEPAPLARRKRCGDVKSTSYVYLLCVLLASLWSWAQADNQSSPVLLDEGVVPGAELVAHEAAEQRSRWLWMADSPGRGRHVRADQDDYLQGTLHRATYRLPTEVVLADVEAAVLAVTFANSDERYRKVFTCEGRDCGRSTLWANRVFERPELLGLDLRQRYVALASQSSRIAMYLVHRANRRAYLHVEFLTLSDEAERQPGAGDFLRDERNRAYEAESGLDIPAQRGVAQLRKALERDGFVVFELTSKEIRADGQIALSAAQVGSVVAALEDYDVQRLELICHRYGKRGTQVLLNEAEKCTRSVVAHLAGTDPRLSALATFALGPLAPEARLGDRWVVRYR